MSGDKAWVLQLDNNGSVVLDKVYGATKADKVFAIERHTDGGLVLAGSTLSTSGSSTDIWVFHIDTAGSVVWNKTFGGAGNDNASSIKRTADDGYILSGSSVVAGKEPTAYMVKVGADGNFIWEKNFNEMPGSSASSIMQPPHGGYVLGGAVKSASSGFYNMLIMSVDANGSYEVK